MPTNFCVFLQRKQTTAVAYKRIQGGVQPDISLHVTSNFKWSMLSLKLCPYGTPNIQLPFRVEKRYRSKAWSTNCNSCMVESWVHKPYTIMRVQFCKEYIGVRLQFVARVGDLFAATETPIILLKRHAPPPSANAALPSMQSPLPTLTGATLRSPTSVLQPEKTQLLPCVSPRSRKQVTRLTAPFTQTSHDSHNVYKPPPQDMKRLGQTITLPVTLLKTPPLVTTPSTASALKAEPISPRQPRVSSKQMTRLTTPFTATSRDSHRVYKARGTKRVGQTTTAPPASAVVAVLTSPMSGQHPEQNQLMTHTSPHQHKQLSQLGVSFSPNSHDSRSIYKPHDMERLGQTTSPQAPSSQAVLMTATGGQHPKQALLAIAPPRPLKQMARLTAPFSPSRDSRHVYKPHDMERLGHITLSPTRLKALPSPTSPLSSTQLSSTAVLNPATLDSSSSSRTSGFCARPNRPTHRHTAGMPSKKRSRAKKGRNISHRDKL